MNLLVKHGLKVQRENGLNHQYQKKQALIMHGMIMMVGFQKKLKLSLTVRKHMLYH
jgi:hypothetical protein